MRIPSLSMVMMFSLVLIGGSSSAAHSVEWKKPDSSMVDGIRVLSPTKVQAGKMFQVKLISKKKMINGICWMDWELSKGFSLPEDFKMKGGNSRVRLLPIEPGPGTMFFTCGTDKRNPLAGGSTQIYIAP